MNWTDAAHTVLTFGKYKDKEMTIGEVAETDEGLKHLNQLAGEERVPPRLKLALDTYLADETIQRELADVLEKGDG